MPASEKRSGLEDLLQQFQAAIFSYDEVIDWFWIKIV